MRGTDFQQSAMFSYLSPEQRVPADHPLRAIRQITDKVLKQLSRSPNGRGHGSHRESFGINSRVCYSRSLSKCVRNVVRKSIYTCITGDGSVVKRAIRIEDQAAVRHVRIQYNCRRDGRHVAQVRPQAQGARL